MFDWLFGPNYRQRFEDFHQTAWDWQDWYNHYGGWPQPEEIKALAITCRECGDLAFIVDGVRMRRCRGCKRQFVGPRCDRFNHVDTYEGTIDKLERSLERLISTIPDTISKLDALINEIPEGYDHGLMEEMKQYKARLLSSIEQARTGLEQFKS